MAAQPSHESPAYLARPIYWTRESLSDIIWALKTSLARVTADELGATPERELWRSASEWLRTAERAVNQVGSGSIAATSFERIPPFPLSGTQLRSLQATIDSIAESHLDAEQATPASPTHRAYYQAMHERPYTPRAALHNSLATLRLAALLLAIPLLLALAAAVLALLPIGPQRLLLGLNVGAVVLALILWWRLRLQLARHHQTLRALAPLAD